MGGGVRGGAPHSFTLDGGPLADAAIVGNDKIKNFLTGDKTNIPIYRFADSNVDRIMKEFINSIIKSDDSREYIACYSLIDIWDASGISPECIDKDAGTPAICESIDLKQQIDIFTNAFKVALNTFEKGKEIDIEVKVSNNFIAYLKQKISSDKWVVINEVAYPHLIFEDEDNDKTYFQLTIKKGDNPVCAPINIDKHFSLKEVLMLLTGNLSDPQNGGSKKKKKKKIVGGSDTDSEEEEEDEGDEDAKKKNIERKLRILNKIRIILESKVAGSNNLDDIEQNIIATLFKQMGDLGKIYAALFSFARTGTSVLQTKDVLCFVQYIIKSLEIKHNEMGNGFPFEGSESINNQICLLGTQKKTILFKCTQATGNLEQILRTYVNRNYGNNYSVDIESDGGVTNITVVNNSNGKERILLIDNSQIDWQQNIGTPGLDKGKYLKKLYDIRTVIDTFIATCSGTTGNSLSNECLSRLEKRLENLKYEIRNREKKMIKSGMKRGA